MEPPPPTRQRKTSKILFESLGGTCQVEPEEKGLLGARAEEMEAEEPKAACVSVAQVCKQRGTHHAPHHAPPELEQPLSVALIL